jgi:hypothetical protein
MFKKVVLIVVVSFMALVMLAVAVAGVAATAGLATAAAVISESGVVEAFEEVADGADRLQIELQDNSVTFTNPDSGESRTIVANERFGRGRVQFDLPEVTVSDADGETVVFSPGWYVEDGVRLPEITITDPDTGQSRVIVPSSERIEDGRGSARIVVNGREYGSFYGLRFVGEFLRGLFVLAALVLIGAGAFVLLRRRDRQLEKVEPVKGDDIS